MSVVFWVPFVYFSVAAGCIIHLFDDSPLNKWAKKAPSKEARTIIHIFGVLTGFVWFLWLIWCILRYLGKGVYDLVPRRAAKITVPRAIVVDTDRKQV